MIAIHYLFVLFAVVITSCFYFPFVLEALPIANSKMILAVFGVIWWGCDVLRYNKGIVNKDFFNLSLWALAVSFIAFVSITLNDTPDDTFVSYVMSMWVWLAGAYAAISIIKLVHGKVSVPLVINYLLAVCVLQCMLALIFDSFPSAAAWHSRTFAGEGYMGNTDEERLHGIGCSLDVAGFRFSAVIVMVVYLLFHRYKYKINQHSYLYLFAVLFVVIVGNMISRSTVIGIVCALFFLLLAAFSENKIRQLLAKMFLVAGLVIAVSVVLYNTNLAFKENLRFGFEGFFSLAETGEWETNSNNILKNMVVWPDNFKTWVIGDGYINNPLDKGLSTFDPFYVGESFAGYYKGTDIGYLRYIFYFGIVGLGVFSLFLFKVCLVCMRYLSEYKWMFLLVLLVNFIQWFKVSTDLFIAFAPFLCLIWGNLISNQDNENIVIKD